MQNKSLVLIVLVLSISLGFVLAGPTPQNLQAFAQWVQQHKIHSKVNLGRLDGYGLSGIARVDINEGDPILMVPSGILISNKRIKSESFLKDFTEWGNVIAFEPTLVWLIFETSNENSPWKPYIDILPDAFPTHPLSWTPEELAEAAGTGLDTTTNAIRELLQKSFANLDEKLVQPNKSAFPGWSFERYLWAYQVVNSRSWAVTDADGTRDNVLVPLADMLNHQPGAGIGSLSEDKTYFVINATTSYTTGAQVFDNYGPKTNYELLSTYGFLLEENPDDGMILQFQLKPTNLVHTIVEPLLQRVDPNYRSIKIRPNRIPVELLRVFRLASMEFSELERVADALQGKGVSLTNELRAYRAAISSLSSMLKSFNTTIEQDVEQLKSTELSNNVRNAIFLRKSHKEIITRNILILGKLWENILLSGELLGGVAV
jgi:histone-lysine N-methyltransferase SETD3